MYRALVSASSDMHTRQEIRCVYGHWVLHCESTYETRGIRVWFLLLVISLTKQGVRFVTGLGVLVL